MAVERGRGGGGEGERGRGGGGEVRALTFVIDGEQ